MDTAHILESTLGLSIAGLRVTELSLNDINLRPKRYLSNNAFGLF